MNDHEFRNQLSILPHTTKVVQLHLGLDHSMTHCYAGSDTVALSKFNVGTKKRSGSTDPASKVGLKVQKHFEEHGFFLGTVTEFDKVCASLPLSCCVLQYLVFYSMSYTGNLPY
jgi:hypothetical protein